MGFFSWKTADTKESIPSIHSSREPMKAYLLQPGGAPALLDNCAYEGYGKIAGVDVYEWLAEQNFGDKTLVDIAITADCGHYYVDENNVVYMCSMHINEKHDKYLRLTLNNPDGEIVYFSNYGASIDKLGGMSANDAIAIKVLHEQKIPLKYPLKFSQNPDAVYEELPASETCENQGFFYE